MKMPAACLNPKNNRLFSNLVILTSLYTQSPTTNLLPTKPAPKPFYPELMFRYLALRADKLHRALNDLIFNNCGNFIGKNHWLLRYSLSTDGITNGVIP